MTIIVLFTGLAITLLAGFNMADAALRESRRKVTDDVQEIDAELALNAKIRQLQGVSRVGDELTERYNAERVGRVRLATKPKLKSRSQNEKPR